MIHLVFNEPDIHVLQQAIELDESLTVEIVCIKDDFAVGPLQNIYIGDGRTSDFRLRKNFCCILATKRNNSGNSRIHLCSY